MELAISEHNKYIRHTRQRAGKQWPQNRKKEKRRRKSETIYFAHNARRVIKWRNRKSLKVFPFSFVIIFMNYFVLFAHFQFRIVMFTTDLAGAFDFADKIAMHIFCSILKSIYEMFGSAPSTSSTVCSNFINSTQFCTPNLLETLCGSWQAKFLK